MQLRDLLSPFRVIFIIVSAFSVCISCFVLNCLSYVLIRPFSKPAYRRATAEVFRAAFLYHGWFARFGNIQMKTHGDTYPRDKSTLLIMNHHATVDWVLLPGWMGDLGYPYPGNLKFIAKDTVGAVPFFGWVMHQMEWIFIARSWKKDHQRFIGGAKNLLNYTQDTGMPLCLILFPEGTRMSPGKRQLSQNFAAKSGYPIFEHVLMPRFRGFRELIPIVRDSIDYVVDATFVFDKVPTLMGCMTGSADASVRIHSKKYPINELPEDRDGLEKWLLERWIEKEERLKEFSNDPVSLGAPNSEGFSTPNYAPLMFLGFLTFAGAATAFYAASKFKHGIRNLCILAFVCVMASVAVVVINLLPKSNDRVAARPPAEGGQIK